MRTLTEQRERALAKANRVRQERVKALAAVRYAPSIADSMSACADVIERRPEGLLTTDVHEIIEQCVGIGPEGADALLRAASMFRAYRLGELPATKAAALVALLRLTRPGEGTNIMPTTTALRLGSSAP